MKEVRVLTKKALPLVARAVSLVLAVELVVLLSGDGAVPSELLMLRAVAVLVVSVLLLPYPVSHTVQAGALLLALWGLVGAVVLILGVAVSGVAPLLSPELWLVAAGGAMLVWLFGSLALGLAQVLGDRRGASHATLALLLLSLALPLWSSPLVAVFGAAKWLVNTVVALCPASYLAALGGIDYLRSDWFYRHTPFGGLRYDYPDPVLQSAVIALVLALALLLAHRHSSSRADFSNLSQSSEL